MEKNVIKRPVRKYLKWAAALACLLLFALIACHLPSEGPFSVDKLGFSVVNALRCRGMTLFFKLFTNLAHPVALLPLGLVFIALSPQRSYRLAIYFNLVLSTVLNLALKAVFLRGRPADIAHLVNETGYSFPSGHAMAAMAFYGFLIFLILQDERPKKQKRLIVCALSLTILLICISRIYLGVHYASDVLAGCLISTAYLLVFSSIVKRYLVRGETEKMERNSGKKNERLWESFVHAYHGIVESVEEERNLMIHFSAMTLAVLFGFLLRISKTEWIVCVIFFGMVISAELINTSIETVVDICSPQEDPRARIAKDTAAGAVLVCAAAAAIGGCIIFVPKLWTLFAELL